MAVPIESSSSFSIWHIVVVVFGAVTTLATTLALWILNSVSNRVTEVKEEADKAHKRIDDLEKDRTVKWLAQGKECSDENAELARIQILLRIICRKLKINGTMD